MVGGEEPLVANPEINLIRKDGRIVAIEILCRCGETITLECELEGDDGAGDSSMTNGQRVAP
jgi:hypothetical protein